jgi:hypothetical protein
MKRHWWLSLLLTAASLAASPWQDDMALRDSMTAKGPLLGHRWLEKNGLEDYLLRQSWKPMTDSGLVCVGRWSYGPSLKVSLRVTADDTVVCLTRGSGASLIRFRSQDSVTLDLLGDVNFAGIPRRAILADTLVVAGIHSGGTGLEVHGVSNPAQPNLLSRVDLPVVNDIAVKDSLVYVACEDDTLRIYNIANPRLPVLVGSCRDSCDLFMTQAGNYCYLVHVSGVNIVDVSDPASPHRSGHIGGGEPLAVCVRDTLCYVTVYQYGLRVWDISDVGSPQQVGSLPGPDALDIGMAATCDTVVYTPVFDAISVAQPTDPRLLGHVDIPEQLEYGVGIVPTLSYGLAAAYATGLVAVDIRNPAAPTLDTTVFSAGSVVDIDVAGNRAYLASDRTGMAILDVSNPAQPSLLGRLPLPRTNYLCRSVVADDSFAFLQWYQVPQFRSIDVSDPTRPTLAGGASVTNPPEDMVLRDSLVYAAEATVFEIVNVARPREPVLVGSCFGDGVAIVVQDSFAYTAAGAIRITNIARPDSPFVVSTITGPRGSGLAIRDTFLYIPQAYDTLWVYSVSSPSAPRVLGFAPVGAHCWDVALGESLAAVATVQGLVLFSLGNAARPARLGSVTTPYDPRRVSYVAPYWYVAMFEAGVAIYETTSTAIGEPVATRPQPRAFRVWPSVAAGNVRYALTGPVRNSDIAVYDVTGVKLRSVLLQANMKGGAAEGEMNLADLPAGVYVVRVYSEGTNLTAKVVRTKGR